MARDVVSAFFFAGGSGDAFVLVACFGKRLLAGPEDVNPNVSSRANPGPEDVKTPLSVKTPLEELASLMLP
jgi:hypothetical protein